MVLTVRVAVEDNSPVSLPTTVGLLPEEAPFSVVDIDAAVDVAGVENLDPGTVGSVWSMLRSDSCQRTCMP